MSNAITINQLYDKLAERVSGYNAKLLLHAALVQSGAMSEDRDSELHPETAKTICLELIKKGGPAFQVGKEFYSRLQ